MRSIAALALCTTALVLPLTIRPDVGAASLLDPSETCGGTLDTLYAREQSGDGVGWWMIDVAAGDSGRIYVLQSNVYHASRVIKMRDHAVLHIWNVDHGLPLPANAMAITTDSNENVYVSLEGGCGEEPETADLCVYASVFTSDGTFLRSLNYWPNADEEGFHRFLPDIAVDTSGYVWLMDLVGQAPPDFRVTRWKPDFSESVTVMGHGARSIVADRIGSVYVATSNGISRFRGTTLEQEYPLALPEFTIAGDSLICGAGGSGLVCYRTSDGVVQSSLPNPFGPVRNWVTERVRLAAPDRFRVLGVGTTLETFGPPINVLQSFSWLSLDLIDPLHRVVTSGMTVLPDSGVWACSADYREGVVADSVSQLVVRVCAPGLQEAEISLADVNGDEGDIGSLSLLNGAEVGTTVTIPAVRIGENDYALALYRAPAEFVRAGLEKKDEESKDRRVALVAELRFAGVDTALADTLKVRRPPVALLHGVWSSADGAFPQEARTIIADGGKRTVVATSYQQTNQSHFQVNRAQPMLAIRAALAVERERNHVAATRADLVVHSMGGLLTRLYSQSELYRRPDNYNQGDIYRLLTIDTPHFGTPLADFAVSLLDSGNPLVQGVVDLLERMMNEVSGNEKSLRGGAVEDLRWKSPAILSLREFTRPSHALVGIASEFPMWDSSYRPTIEGTLWSFLPQVTTLSSNIYCNEAHDWLVSENSQKGGKRFGYTMLPETSHTQAVERGAVSIAELLDLQTSNTAWSDPFVRPEYSVYCPTAALASSLVPKPQSETWSGTVEIVNPQEGADVVPGESLPISIVVQDAPPGTRVLVVGGLLAMLNEPPFQTSLTIPSGSIGNIGFFAIALDDSVIYGVSDVRHVHVELPAPVNLEFSPGNVALAGPNDVFPLSLVGSWADGAQRDVTGSSLGAAYSISDEGVARVGPDGAVTAVAKGVATVTGSFDGVTASASVEVLGSVPVPSPDQFPPQITFESCPDTLALGAQGFVNVTVTDELSGVEYQSVPSGSHALDTSTPGPHTFSVIARDFVGHESTEQCDYYVQYPLAVVFGGFSATAHGDGARLEWRVEHAEGLIGFNVYRLDPGSHTVRVNAEMLPPDSRAFVDERLMPGSRYNYRVGAVDHDGEFLSPAQEVSVPVRPLALDPSWPNPTTGKTELSFYLPEAAQVELTIYDVAGRRVRTLLRERRDFGSQGTTWDGKNASGASVPSGVYFSRLTVGGHVLTRKIVVTR